MRWSGTFSVFIKTLQLNEWKGCLEKVTSQSWGVRNFASVRGAMKEPSLQGQGLEAQGSFFMNNSRISFGPQRLSFPIHPIPLRFIKVKLPFWRTQMWPSLLRLDTEYLGGPGGPQHSSPPRLVHPEEALFFLCISVAVIRPAMHPMTVKAWAPFFVSVSSYGPPTKGRAHFPDYYGPIAFI